MAFRRTLPPYDVLKELYEGHISSKDIAARYGVTAKSVTRALRRGEQQIARGEIPSDFKQGAQAGVQPERPTDLVDKRLIYGELFDFMRGYDMSVMEMSGALKIDTETLRHVIHPNTKRIRRDVAHRIVNAVMAYERKHGDPPDLYPLREFQRSDT